MRAFTNELMKIIRCRVEKEGPITFKDFMDMALYHEEFGYYVRSELAIGKKGDFVTSPHTHAIFGALLARQIEEFWSLLGEGKFSIVEIGAGSGYLCKDILSYLSNRKIYKEIEYVIVERMSETASYQKELLRPLIGKVRWVERLSEIDTIKGCIITNEVLDAFPVHLVQKVESEFKEVYVKLDNEDNLIEVLGDLSKYGLVEYVNELYSELSNGYRTEINFTIKKWVEDVSNVISEGFIVTVDYGHTHREYFNAARNRGTLLAYKGHSVSEKLYENPGEQDLTAHVNFSDLWRWGKEYGLDTLGYARQSAFLAGLDIEKTFRELSGGKLEPFSPESAAIKMLLLPHGMGETHKVLVQGKGVGSGIDLKGFSISNIKKRLEDR